MGKFQLDKPQMIQTTAQQTAVIHLITPRENIRFVMGDGYQELMAVLAKQGVNPTGPWFTHHSRLDPNIFAFEIGVPVSQPISPEGRVTGSELPSLLVARTIYRGDYERLGGAWAEFDQWLAANRNSSTADFYEHYLTGPEVNPDPDSWQTELIRPLIASDGGKK